jgi:hypothetical protein
MYRFLPLAPRTPVGFHMSRNLLRRGPPHAS